MYYPRSSKNNKSVNIILLSFSIAASVLATDPVTSRNILPIYFHTIAV